MNETTDDLNDLEKAAANVAMIQFSKKYPQFNLTDNKATFDKILDETIWTINTFLTELDKLSNGDEEEDA